MWKLISFIFLAIVLGFKHSYDADHMIAVSSMLKNVKSLKSSIKIGFSWAVGHMLTAGIVTFLLYIFKDSILKAILPHFEKIAGVMLIMLGAISLKDIFIVHSHKHSHGNLKHSHIHMHTKPDGESHVHKHIFGIGIIHGLASNDELLMLLTTSFGITTLGGLMLGVGFFSLGVIIGMTLFCAVFTYPIIKTHSKKIYRIVSLGTGAASIAYGSLMILALAQ